MDDLRNVWAIPTVDSTGKPVKLFVGEIEHQGRLETGVRIDGGPIVIVPLPEVVSRVLAALRQTAEATWRKNLEEDR
ncbi:hypothetical protein QRX60_35460 [Amycolatopsis mongoliensis]|uniref:Uncharacterized protein n=1 Tax=Amycolatopsis mongoliensis TaxID=715475 RepID=A0A9Y2JKD5_9PSEU|nr:hypothetical protein [Amycolatopsis sp. 4-36]WIX99319.1 hypothetical protein QRX60_35460 [Amycolatopsis sp. 4-36]